MLSDVTFIRVGSRIYSTDGSDESQLNVCKLEVEKCRKELKSAKAELTLALNRLASFKSGDLVLD